MRYKLFVFTIFMSILGYAMNPRRDIIVYGNSSAAVIAAVQSARMGKNTLFIASDQCIGGLTASGLGATDINNYKAIGGLSREFYKRIYQYYDNPKAWNYQDKEEYFASIQKRVFTGRNQETGMQWVFEPKVAQKVFMQMLEEEKVDIVFGKLRQKRGAVIKKGVIKQIYLIGDDTAYEADVFIDASYEGDLMGQTAVSNFVGRESNAVYNETMNGILPGKNIKKSRMRIDPYVVEGDVCSGMLPFIEKEQPGKVGEGDKRIQAYCFRFVLTNNPDNKKEIEKPKDYMPLWYEYMARLLKANPTWTLRHVLTITPMPNMKSDINHADFVGANYEWPEATYQRREELKAMHRSFTLGLIWFLANDPRVPVKIRNEMKEWGLPKDEFVDNGNFPCQLYVREARRMIGEYVMTEHEVTGTRTAPNSIGLGTYWFDSHIVSRFIDETGALRDEGGFWGRQFIYPISYQSVLPQRNECTNLIVPVCLSASHAAYGSIRMEPVYMVLGQSAAIAAALSVDVGQPVQDVDYEQLRYQLLKYNQIIDRSSIKYNHIAKNENNGYD